MARPKQTHIQEEAKNAVKENLKRLMKSKGSMSQVELSELTGIPKQTINGYVKGTSLPTPGNTEKLSRFFNVSKGDIDPRFNTNSLRGYDVEASMSKLNEKESAFFEQMFEKILSLDENERDNFLENVGFAVELLDKKRK